MTPTIRVNGLLCDSSSGWTLEVSWGERGERGGRERGERGEREGREREERGEKVEGRG